ncbi:hypothetical protein N9B82_04965 [Saprospiraceae bacterium]|nr:hypothetical protein [Saprospiraceae bacterium]
MNYRKQIEDKLKEANWNIASIDADRHWWDDEHWKSQYKYDHQLTFYICFIVDPQFEGVRKKEVKALIILKHWDPFQTTGMMKLILLLQFIWAKENLI